MKAKVNPPKRPNHAHKAWRIARKDGQIVRISTAESHRQHGPCMAVLKILERFLNENTYQITYTLGRLTQAYTQEQLLSIKAECQGR